MAGLRNERAGWGDDAPALGTDPPEPWQPALPLLRNLFRPARDDDFAHPAERDLARILTYYRVRWAYEPTTFILSWAADGHPAEMFTPDFYLPDHHLYIELTTMRQRLVTRKNRKLRRLRELYPNVRIKLLYGRDYRRLVDCFRPLAGRVGPCRAGETVYGEQAIARRIAELAARIAADEAAAGAGRDDPLLVLGVGRGAERFLAALIAALGAHGARFETDAIRLTRLRRPSGACRVRVRRGPQPPLAGRRVLLVEDVISTGLSLRYLVGWLRRQRVAAIEVCTLLDRRVARLVDVPIRYAGFEAPNELLVGFGLHLRRQFRDLPYIAAVEPAPVGEAGGG